MKKYKKILLGVISMTSLAMVVPIVAASCSSSTNLDSNSTIEKPQERPSLKGDKTNDNSYTPTLSGGTLYSNINDELLKSFPANTNLSVNEVISKYSQVKDEDVSDVVNMWSFNKWFDTKNKNNLSKQIISRIENMKISKTNEKWNISFEYLFELMTNDGTKLFGQKEYVLSSSSLSSNVIFSTKAIKFEIDGKNQLNTINKQSYFSKNSNAIESIKEFLNESKSTFNVKSIISEFLNKKEIYGTLATWKEESVLASGVSLSNNNQNLIIDLNEIQDNWNGINKDSTEEQIIDILIYKKNSEYRSNTKLGILKSNFQNLINNEQNILKNFEVHKKVHEDGLLDVIVNIISNDFDMSTIHILFKNYKTTN